MKQFVISVLMVVVAIPLSAGTSHSQTVASKAGLEKTVNTKTSSGATEQSRFIQVWTWWRAR